MIGTFGPHMADSVFMPAPPPTPSLRPNTNDDSESEKSEIPNQPRIPPVLMEFFPGGMFRRDQEFAVKSLGMRYIAFWNDRYVIYPPHPLTRPTIGSYIYIEYAYRKFTGNSLPPVMGLSNGRTPKIDDWQIAVDVKVVLETVRDEAETWRRS